MGGDANLSISRRHGRGGALLFVDLVAFAASIAAALVLRFGLSVPYEHQIPYLYFWPLLLIWRVFCAGAFDLYDFRRRLTLSDFAFNAVGASVVAVLGGYILLATVQLYYLPETKLSRVVAGIDLVLLALWFIASRGFALMLLRARGYCVRLLVLGQEASHVPLAEEIRAHAPKMLDVITAKPNETQSYAAALGDALAAGRVDQIVLADVALPQAELNALLAQCDRSDADVFLLPGIDMSIIANTRVCSIAGLPLIPMRPSILTSAYGPVKRIVDVTVSVVLVILGLPIAAIVALLIRAESAGPVLFSQERAGRDRKPYRLYKFRTMIADAELETGPVLSQRGDPRVTRLGRTLRKYRVDEWPQLWNVLLGQMSLVGPRPERPEFIERFIAENPLYERRFLVKPGLTGLAQIHGRYDSDYAHKLRYDLIYINSVSFLTDAQILASTIRTIFTGYGAR
ncbi:MAG: exopolysaccharide biosynthesis polyprenyl glycosylphosphotransferase [Candidatus Hydrogenedentes bacterium]|nr:exopolysaccharide biosynthesis polyprenyl glycosylphosphotransferase [Candidatus Hydrogenedentota bacterium]